MELNYKKKDKVVRYSGEYQEDLYNFIFVIMIYLF